jgi:hypothetical protein
VGALFAVPLTGVLAAIFQLAHERALRRLARDEPPRAKMESPKG